MTEQQGTSGRSGKQARRRWLPRAAAIGRDLVLAGAIVVAVHFLAPLTWGESVLVGAVWLVSGMIVSFVQEAWERRRTGRSSR
ncbi:hypothetical protein [Streptomyces poonensis]|uniref:Uncharacterized protein n=1 Tax=Streptomyces poonensis TaxID=68255 RepID=A0A918PJC0_9ACTN|nr:hypothetical protein [Streptomyces poonensis]GGZ10427.1 hypothetical protein GCM10010365_32080 [Streptomyces poonensis]GLJ91371.1 hypothetical protein GCM10017589_39780 [Streptomyces poonensis]